MKRMGIIIDHRVKSWFPVMWFSSHVGHGGNNRNYPGQVGVTSNPRVMSLQQRRGLLALFLNILKPNGPQNSSTIFQTTLQAASKRWVPSTSYFRNNGQFLPGCPFLLDCA
jgi:hypothetical protein